MPRHAAAHSEAGRRSHFDLDFNTRRKLELHESVNCLGVAVVDVKKPAVGIELELLAGLLVDESGTVDSEDLLVGGKRNGTIHLRASGLHGVHDLSG